DRRVVVEDAHARDVRLRLAWSGAGFANPDKGPLNALASVMQGSPASGLTKTLVFDRQLATSVTVAHIDVERGGVFQIEVSPRGATPLGTLEDVIDSVVQASLKTLPSDAELRRFKNSNAVTATVTLQGRLVRADTLAQGESWANDPVAYAKQVNAVARMTPE